MNHFLLFAVFFATLITVFGGMQYLVYRAYKQWYAYVSKSEEQFQTYRKIGLGFIILGNTLFIPRFFIPQFGLQDVAAVQWFIINPGGIYFAIIFLLFLGVSVWYATRVLIKLWERLSVRWKSEEDKQQVHEVAYDPSRRDFIKKAGLVAFSAPALISTGAAIRTHHNYQISEVGLWYENLPSGLEGLKIAHISDIHSGMYMNRRQIQEIFELTNSLDPNMTIITGDIVDNHVNEIPNVRDSINMLKTDYGVFGVPGNHDHYADIGAGALMDALSDRKITMLQNSSSNLTINGEKLSIIGVDDNGNGDMDFMDLDASLRNANPDAFRMMLTHRPHVFDTNADANLHLTLAGHTHGGQVAIDLPGIEFYPIDFFQKYSRGLYTDGYRHLYVNTGVGLVAAPIRLVRPEITLLTLTSDKTQAEIKKRSV